MSSWSQRNCWQSASGSLFYVKGPKKAKTESKSRVRNAKWGAARARLLRLRSSAQEKVIIIIIKSLK
jgi:hypothetical protein